MNLLAGSNGDEDRRLSNFLYDSKYEEDKDMKKMPKAVSIPIMAAVTASLLAGCAGSSTAGESSGATTTAAETSTAASEDATTGNSAEATEKSSKEANAERENVNIRFAQFGNSVDDVEGMKNDPIKKAIEDAVNVTLEYDTGTDGFDDRMQTELFTGGAADLFPTWGETDKISKWAEEDLVVNIADIINGDPERYPILHKIINSESYKTYNKIYTGNADAAYAIYSVSAFAQPAFSGVPVYNTAILENVNDGKTPATVQEFIDFTKACGSNGYVGWWPRNDKLTNWTQINNTLALPQGTSIIPPTGDAWSGFMPEGEIGTDSEHWKLTTTSEKSKEVVKQLAEMYKAGGLDSGIGVKGDFDDAYADFGEGKIGAADFGFGYPGQFRDFYNTAWAAVNENAQMSDLTLGTSLTSNGNYGKIYTTGTWIGAHYFIPTTCKYPDRVLDLVEFIASTEGQDLLFNTQNYKSRTDQGSDFWKTVDTPYGYSDGRCKYVWFSYMLSGTEYEVDFVDNDWWEAVSHPIDYSNEWATDADAALVDYANGVISGFVNDVVVYLPSYYNVVSLPSEATDIRTKLQDITNQYLTQMIGGQLDVESSWNDYASEYEQAGASKLETMVNDAITNARNSQ